MYSRLKGSFLALICMVLIEALCSGLEVHFGKFPYIFADEDNDGS